MIEVLKVGKVDLVREGKCEKCGSEVRAKDYDAIDEFIACPVCFKADIKMILIEKEDFDCLDIKPLKLRKISPLSPDKENPRDHRLDKRLSEQEFFLNSFPPIRCRRKNDQDNKRRK